MTKIILIVFVLNFTAITQAADNSGKDIRIFQNNARLCDHFAGEWDSDLPGNQKKMVENSIEKYCGAAKRQLAALKDKYKGDPQVQATLVKTLTKYEAVENFE